MNTKIRNLFEFKIFLSIAIIFVVLLMLNKHVLTQNISSVPTKIMPYRLNNEKRLIDDLFRNYQVKFGRPVNNMSEKVVVYFEVCLIQLIDLDERNQVLITNVQTQYVWKDNGLKWDKSAYGGIDDVRLPVIRIWTPDIVLYNYADTRLEEKRDVLAIVSSDGTVKWRPPSIFKSTCQIDIEKFPYDYQNCSMKFGSWTYDGDSIDIQFLGKQEINRELYITSNEWDILSADGKRNEKKYECCKEVYPDITFHIMMKRKGGFYNYILVLPCVLLSCLTTVLFWLPPESPAKMVLGMNIFTSFFVLLLLLSKNVPSATDKIPLIGAYYCLNMVMIATSTCCCTVVVHIFFRGQGQVPYIIRKVFLETLARIFCMVAPPVLPPAAANKDKQHNQTQKQQPATIITSVNNPTNQSNGNLMHHVNRGPILPTANNRLTQQQSNSISCTALNTAEETSQLLNCSLQTQQLQQQQQMPQQILNDPSQQHYYHAQASFQTLPLQGRSTSYHHHQPNQTGNQHTPYAHPHQQQQQQQQQQQPTSPNLQNELSLSFNLIENDIKEIRDYLRHTRKKLENTDSKSKQTNEWKQVALVLDRTLFYLYIIGIIVSVTVMFPR